VKRPARGRPARGRPDTYLDFGVQHERTALAWERTALAMMVAGVALAREAAVHGFLFVAFLGLLQVLGGGAVLVWSGLHYEELHGPLRRTTSIVHPLAARLIGQSVVLFTGVSAVFAFATVVS
jgi:uncharacterized membrane protein YidH (DUF202 family)